MASEDTVRRVGSASYPDQREDCLRNSAEATAMTRSAFERQTNVMPAGVVPATPRGGTTVPYPPGSPVTGVSGGTSY